MEFKTAENKYYKERITELTKSKPDCFPASSVKWNIFSYEDVNPNKPPTVYFDKHRSERSRGFPFYKNYSRVFDLTKTDGNKGLF